ncbi:hypothetical protein COS75_02660 [Candidatus Pacearchaeota archaeon CG06_land_8_20_14_3_00_35_12]|nr:MAG: hypothetical protein COS75_02660 [Candidatus Pacearchaeota archaeon CG06_land_8_20_14_3_00_35_12]
MMKNKRAWVRILEAVVAIMLIIGFILYLHAREEKPSLTEQMYQTTHGILSEANANETVRNAVLRNDIASVATVKSFFDKRLSQYNFNYTFTICNLDAVCPLPETAPNKEIYADNIIISASPTAGAEAKKLSIFVWF